MRRSENPPPGSRRVLEWAARRLGLPELADDATELFRERARRDGAGRAARWYRRQTASAVWRLAGAAIRGVRVGRGRGGRAGGIGLDVKLGLRMLARYPGLTVVGGLALAFATFIGATTFAFIGQMVDPDLPLPEGDRVVGLRYWDRAANDQLLPAAEDILRWRDALSTVVDVGGFRSLERNLSTGGDAGDPVRVAHMSPAGFDVARVAPLLGRSFTSADAEPGAPPVVVLGYDVWRSRLGGAADVLGREIRLGGAPVTVIGVMPDGYRFPRDHDVWTPLRLEASAGLDGLRAFGRLAAGATLESAAAEVAALGVGAAAHAPPGAERLLVAEALPYIDSFSRIRLSFALRALLYHVNLYAVFFLVLVSANVALLMFARAITRERELLVRNALGASRGRIVMQLFVEALVLGGVAAIVGIGATGPALAWVLGQLELLGGVLPFWNRPRLSPATVGYAVGLAVLAAVVAGVVPGLKATSRDMHARLRQVTAGAGGLRLGGIWTAIVVAQIAATVVFTGVAYVVARQALRSATVAAHFPAGEYIGMRVELDQDTPGDDAAADSAFQQRYARAVRDLEGRLAAHPAVRGVALTQWLPMKIRATATVEVEGALDGATGAAPQHTVFAGAVGDDFFELLGAPVVTGRTFDTRDAGEDSRPVVVNASFVRDVLGGRSALGRRIRYVERDRAEEPGPWHEIVGVVGDLVDDRTRTLALEDPPNARIYHRLQPERVGSYPLHLVAHVPSAMETVAATLHATATAVSPLLRVHEPLTLDRTNSDLARLWRLWTQLIVLVSVVALVLSLAGIYAVMSFAVSRRTREIGIRIALGGNARRVIADIFRRPLRQLAAGVLVGCVMVAALVWRITDGRASVGDLPLLAVFALVMAGVCALACAAPMRRALRVQPAEALGAEQ